MTLSKRLFQLMLLAYPREFRLEYGSDMTQLFRDCYRDNHSRDLATMAGFWLHMIVDVIRTAPVERWETLGETMKNLKRDALGLLACFAIIVVAFLLLNYGHKHEPAWFFVLGYALDAIISAGVISNLIIFALLMSTRLSAFRTALWSLLIVHAALFLIAVLIATRVGGFNFPAVFISYVVSFSFWLAIHWLWSKTRTATEPVA